MALIPVPPHIQLLQRMQEVIAAPDYVDLAGTAGPVTARQARNRKPVKSERPCITLIFVGDSYVQGELGHTEWEVVREMTVDLQADVELATEESEDDVTGLLVLSRMLAVAMTALREEGGAMFELSDWVIAGDIEPEDRSQPDDGRLVRVAIVRYRVHAQDPNVLLATGVNA